MCFCVNLFCLQDRAQQQLCSVAQGYNWCTICWAIMLCFMVRSSLPELAYFALTQYVSGEEGLVGQWDLVYCGCTTAPGE